MLLRAFEKQKKHVDYYAVDLDRNELERSFAQAATSDFSYVTFQGLHGDYEDAKRWLTSNKVTNQKNPSSHYIISLGSSVGQYRPEAVAEFLHSFTKLLTPKDAFILAVDGNEGRERK